MIPFKNSAHLIAGMMVAAIASTVLVSNANASGICLTASSNIYSGGELGTDPSPAIFGCNYGFFDTTGGFGGVVTKTPNSLPSPLSNLTSATLSFSDPRGTHDSAAASLATGTLGAFDFGDASGDGNGAGAALNDVVHFHVTGTTNPVSVGFNVHLSGTETGGGFFNNNFSLTFVGVLGFQMDNLGGHTNNFAISSDPGWGTFTNTSQRGFDYSGTVMVTNNQAIPLIMALSLGCTTSETCDFSHTAGVSFNLPSNVTFTSDSGVLLTQTAGTPEPASFVLIGVGLVVLLAIRKKVLA